MRLKILKNGHTFLQKLQFRVIKKMMGEVPGPIAVMSYRRQFFGKHFAPWLNQAMRKMKHWTVGEVELMAAFVSKNNECQYCYGDHVAVAKMCTKKNWLWRLWKTLIRLLLRRN